MNPGGHPAHLPAFVPPNPAYADAAAAVAAAHLGPSPPPAVAPPPANAPLFQSPNHGVFLENLRRQQRNEQFTDMILLSSELETFPIHSLVANNVSPTIFRAGLAWREANGEGTVIIPMRYDTEIVRAVVDVMYTGGARVRVERRDEFQEALRHWNILQGQRPEDYYVPIPPRVVEPPREIISTAADREHFRRFGQQAVAAPSAAINQQRASLSRSSAATSASGAAAANDDDDDEERPLQIDEPMDAAPVASTSAAANMSENQKLTLQMLVMQQARSLRQNQEQIIEQRQREQARLDAAAHQETNARQQEASKGKAKKGGRRKGNPMRIRLHSGESTHSAGASFHEDPAAAASVAAGSDVSTPPLPSTALAPEIDVVVNPIDFSRAGTSAAAAAHDATVQQQAQLWDRLKAEAENRGEPEKPEGFRRQQQLDEQERTRAAQQATAAAYQAALTAMTAQNAGNQAAAFGSAQHAALAAAATAASSGAYNGAAILNPALSFNFNINDRIRDMFLDPASSGAAALNLTPAAAPGAMPPPRRSSAGPMRVPKRTVGRNTTGRKPASAQVALDANGDVIFNDNGRPMVRCETCEKVLADASSLYRHRKIHTGEKPHGCPFCTRRFIQRYNMRQHLRTHMKNRPPQHEIDALEEDLRIVFDPDYDLDGEKPKKGKGKGKGKGKRSSGPYFNASDARAGGSPPNGGGPPPSAGGSGPGIMV